MKDIDLKSNASIDGLTNIMFNTEIDFSEVAWESIKCYQKASKQKIRNLFHATDDSFYKLQYRLQDLYLE